MRTFPKYIILVLLAGAGCSVNPLPDRVTGLETHAIVQKLRCEAQDAVKSIYDGKAATETLYDRKGLVRFRGGYNGERRRAYNAMAEKLKEARGELKVLQAEERRLKDRRAQLQARRSINELKRDKEANDIEKSRAGPDEIVRRANQAQDRFEAEFRRIKYDVTQFKTDNLAYDVRAAAQKRLIEDQEKGFKSTYEDLIKLLSHQLTLQVRFNITEKNVGKMDGSLKIPILLGTVTVDPSAGDERERLGERIVKLVVDFKDLLQGAQDVRDSGKDCRELRPPDGGGPALRYPIVGRIGLAEVVEQYMQISEQAEFQKGTESFTDKIQFKTTISGGVKPKVTITQATGHSFTGNFELSGSRIDLHEVIVGLYREKAKEDDGDADKIVRVQILPNSGF